ncbi:CRAL/TRIO domain-containing protein [Cystobasidium minutum MCA 4210]|uniref:CRAL/TRIO domain-containing protein n=1 Tax=Cystobasidium minutum MCA 4210 TaxID=1397322 RepID=UPI0034CD639F|eukprot:jgi/Rhomi1/34831/CE34830_3828
MLEKHGPAELHKAFWQFCMGEDPDALLLRFLRARKWDVDRAFNMLASTLKWRIETNLIQIVAAGEEGLAKEKGVLKNFQLGKCYFRGTDKQGRPLIFARVKHHKAADQTQEEMLKFIVHNMELSRTLFPLGSGIETSSVVFDMTGFGLSNTDWDTATMAINVFQSYYPETLGHAIVWNAPMVFSAVWKIVKPMLDPVVREKIAFCSNAKEISKYIDLKHLERDFGGSSNWSYEYKEALEDENKRLEDIDTRNTRMNQFVDAAEKVEAMTKKWVNGDDSISEDRREIALKELEVRRFDLDPYIRGRNMFDRDGTVVGDGQVVWHYNAGRTEKFGTSADDWAKDLGIEDPPSRPHNESPYDEEDLLALNSAEDTVSSTDPSDEDPLDDPHHHHHSAVTVGFAKFGDKIANTASKVTPGPSLHEKKRQERARKHEEHEKRRQKKIALKKAKLEEERKRAEEREMTEQQEEEAITSSYAAFLGSIGNMTLGATNKVADYVPAMAGGNYLKQWTDTGDTTSVTESEPTKASA